MVKVTVNFYGVVKATLAEPRVDVEMPEVFTVRQLLDSLQNKCGEKFAQSVVDEHGIPRPHVRMFINKEAVDNYDLDSKWKISGTEAESSILVLPTSEGG